MSSYARLSALSALVLVAAACADPSAPASTSALPVRILAGDPVIVAAGDLVCGSGTAAGTPCKYAETAALVTSVTPDAALLLGDIQYEDGSLADFNAFYNPTWGVHKPITYPAPGNHEYQASSVAAGYFDYYNGIGVQTGRAGTRGQGYYSFNLGAWHIVALNSEIKAKADSAQAKWLQADLAANPAACTLAYWHEPMFSSGPHGNDAHMKPIWDILASAGADVILTGHDHLYERFAPQTSDGAPDPNGIREFVVGTGGASHYVFQPIQPNSEARNNDTYGVLKLTLHTTSYDWEFVPVAGGTFHDMGSAECVGPGTGP